MFCRFRADAGGFPEFRGGVPVRARGAVVSGFAAGRCAPGGFGNSGIPRGEACAKIAVCPGDLFSGDRVLFDLVRQVAATPDRRFITGTGTAALKTVIRESASGGRSRVRPGADTHRITTAPLVVVSPR
ncbi:hypothetical protein FHS29_004696 [Saccharothrix tamanrassetensis]|uniref:Uncharacterized protein n=1 Tax=Saccharothrix tamanrassetensis TaxID=1051531 RepID=A0A841CPM2_9PSEU|nr:hypothetical protein [Saccharothrix tamanrassetensis]MBB5958088.1 hypothetical protein [Saccharothrix tamanrassetensis]